MSWDLDGGGHEGWAAPVLDDGREAHGSSGHGQFVRGITGKYAVDPYMEDVEIVPDVHVAGWRGGCECGWKGRTWTRVFDKESEDISQLKAFVAASDYADADQVVESSIHEEWKAHVAPVHAVLAVEQAKEACRQAERKLTETVITARASKVPWADIGRAAGMTRQAAHERWDKAAKLELARPEEALDD